MTTTRKSTGRKATTATSSTSNTPRYSSAASKHVESALQRKRKGTLRSGPGGAAGTVKRRDQAIAIGLSEARKVGAKVPARPAKKRADTRKSAKSLRV